MGNEPSITAPWAYDFAGDPAGTQRVVRAVVNQLYQPTPGGLPGNDDLGTMSAWYVWAALGMYPEIPGVPGFALASPLFAHAVVHWGGGSRVLVVNGQGAGADSPYVRALSFGGRAFAGSWLTLADIAASGQSTMTYRLSSSQVSPASPTAQSSTPVGSSRMPLGASPAAQGKTRGALRSAVRQSVARGAFQPRLARGASAAPNALNPPSFTYGLAPALGFATQSTVQASPGSTVTFSVGLQAITAAGQPYHLALSIPQPLGLSGVTVVAASEAHGALAPLTVTLPQNAAPGVYPVQVNFTRAATNVGATVPPVTVDVVVSGGATSLFGDYNNVGVSSDSGVSAGNFDGGQRSYSATALRQAGVAPGTSFTADGAAFQWPMFAQGIPDNIQASGQKISLSGSGSRLVFIGAAANGPTQGQGTITYTDGSTQSFQLGFSDWTLGGGGESVSFGNAVVARCAYRNTVDTASGRENVATYLYAAAVPLEPGKTVESVTLPNPSNQGQIHIFLMGFSG